MKAAIIGAGRTGLACTKNFERLSKLQNTIEQQLLCSNKKLCLIKLSRVLNAKLIIIISILR